MKVKFLLVMIFVVFLSYSQNDIAPVLNLQSVINRVCKDNIKGVVRVDVFDKNLNLLTFGSGFFFKQIGSDYYILTNNHIVNDVNNKIVKISTIDDEQFDCVILGKDERIDVAILKIKSDSKFTLLKFGDSSTINIGDFAIGIGNPLGFNGSITFGVVSALGRSFAGKSNATEYIQSDVAINPGNSGGPLINIKGEVIGINSWIFSNTGTYSGLSFSIPINSIKNVVEMLVENKKIEYPFLGLMVNDIDQFYKDQYNINIKSGAVIYQIVENGPCDNQDIDVGDIVIGVDDNQIKNASNLIWVISKYKIGDIVKLKIFSKDKIKEVKIKLGKRPDVIATTKNTETNNKQVNFLGMVLSNINDELKNKYKFENNTGVVVLDFQTTSIGRENGLLIGDLIIKVNNTDIASLDDVSKITEKEKTNSYYLTIVRDNRKLLIRVRDTNK